MKVAGEDREKQNMMFQETVADQRATIELLTQVRGYMMFQETVADQRATIELLTQVRGLRGGIE
jgi:hypothetical protein